MPKADRSGPPARPVLTLLRNGPLPTGGSKAHTKFSPMSSEVSTPRHGGIRAQRSNDPNHKADGTSQGTYVPPPVRHRARWLVALRPWHVAGKLLVSQVRRRRPCCGRPPALTMPIRISDLVLPLS